MDAHEQKQMEILADIAETLRARVDQRDTELGAARARITAFQSSWMPIPSDTTRLSERDVKWRQEFDKMSDELRRQRALRLDMRDTRDRLTVEVGRLQRDGVLTSGIALNWEARCAEAEAAVKLQAPAKEIRELRSDRARAMVQRDQAEAAVQLCWSEMHFQPLENLCVLCHSRHKCGPGHNDSEPCETFTRLEERHAKFAPVRKVLERMKA